MLARHWFFPTLVVLLAGGVSLGYFLSRPDLDALTGWIFPSWTTAVILFLLSFTLDGGDLWRASIGRPMPAIWGVFINLGVGPVLAWLLGRFQLLPDFRYGLLIAGCVPTTLSTASVWTRRAGGNDSVSLVITLIGNFFCFLITPFWLETLTGRGIPLDARAMGIRLLETALLPMILGQLARRSALAREFAARRRSFLGGIAQALVLSTVFTASCDAGTKLAETGRPPSMAAFVLVWGSAIAVHVALLVLGVGGGRLLRFPPRDTTAVAFAASQKTLPIAQFLATDPTMFGHPDLLGRGQSAPYVLLPMLLYHVSQLVIDGYLAVRWGRRETMPEAAPPV